MELQPGVEAPAPLKTNVLSNLAIAMKKQSAVLPIQNCDIF
ncbi:hypothetical protein [Leptothermofonsia sp. ETS-13]